MELQQRTFAKVYMWMFIGLLTTFLTGYIVSINENMLYNVFETGLYYIFLIAEIGIVIFLSARINKMSYMTSVISFLSYSILTGISFALIFIAYNIFSIMMVFGITAIVFAIFAAIGYFTKIDLSKIRTVLFMGLLGIIIVSIIALFIDNVALNLGLIIIGLLLFIGYVAYDIQRIKNYTMAINDPDKVAIYGALQLYLDFINIFIRLLSIFGKRKN